MTVFAQTLAITVKVFQYRLFITFTDFPNGGGKGSDINGNGDLSTDDRKDTSDLGP